MQAASRVMRCGVSLATAFVAAENATAPARPFVRCGPHQQHVPGLVKMGGRAWSMLPTTSDSEETRLLEGSAWHVEAFQHGTWLSPGDAPGTYRIAGNDKQFEMSELVKLCAHELAQYGDREPPAGAPNGSTRPDSFEYTLPQRAEATVLNLASKAAYWLGLTAGPGESKEEVAAPTSSEGSPVPLQETGHPAEMFFQVVFELPPKDKDAKKKAGKRHRVSTEAL